MQGKCQLKVIIRVWSLRITLLSLKRDFAIPFPPWIFHIVNRFYEEVRPYLHHCSILSPNFFAELVYVISFGFDIAKRFIHVFFHIFERISVGYVANQHSFIHIHTIYALWCGIMLTKLLQINPDSHFNISKDWMTFLTSRDIKGQVASISSKSATNFFFTIEGRAAANPPPSI